MSKGLCLIAKETKQRCNNLNPFWNFVEKNITILLKSGYVFFLLMKFAATLLATLAGGLCNTIRGRGLGLALCYGKDEVTEGGPGRKGGQILVKMALHYL